MQQKTRIILYIVIGILSGIGIAAGSAFDLQVSRALFMESSFPARLITLAVCFIFYSSCVFFLGVLLGQLLAGNNRKPVRIIFISMFIYLFVSTAVLAGAEFINDPIFGIQEVNLYRSLIVGTLLYAPSFITGYIVNKGRYSKENVRRLIKMIAVITGSFLMVKYLNTMVIRPSYGISHDNGFVAWYGVSRSGRFLMSLKDLISYSSGSFVCGPAEYAVLFLVIFPTYAIAFPSLRDKGMLLTVTAAILFVLVSIARLISGYNYLSDIAFATFAGVKLCLSCEGIKLIRRKKDTVYS